MTNIIYPTLSSLICISVLYLIASEFIVSDKYKPYVFLVLSASVVMTVIKPLHTVLNTDFSFSYNESESNDSNYRDWFENILIQSDTYEIKQQVINIITDSFPEVEFDVRVHNFSNRSTKIYITVYNNIQNEICYDIRKYISQKTGISLEDVNIYLQTAH